MMEFSIQALTQLREILRGFRKSRGLTQSELAKKLAITQQSYAQLEANPATASIERLFKVLAILEVDLVFKDRKDSLQRKTISQQVNSRKNAFTELMKTTVTAQNMLSGIINPQLQEIYKSSKGVDFSDSLKDSFADLTKTVITAQNMMGGIINPQSQEIYKLSKGVDFSDSLKNSVADLTKIVITAQNMMGGIINQQQQDIYKLSQEADISDFIKKPFTELVKDNVLTAISMVGDKETLRKMIDEELRIAFEEEENDET